MSTVVRFNYWMHDSYQHDERIAIIAESSGVAIDDELSDKIGKPFYEIRLECTLNPETGEVQILGASKA